MTLKDNHVFLLREKLNLKILAEPLDSPLYPLAFVRSIGFFLHKKQSFSFSYCPTTSTSQIILDYSVIKIENLFQIAVDPAPGFGLWVHLFRSPKNSLLL